MSYLEDAGSNPYAAPQANLAYATTPGFGYASFWTRFVAVVVDSFLIGILNFFVGLILGVVLVAANVNPNVIPLITGLAGMVVALGYYGGMVSSLNQATLGKMAMGIKVTNLDGGRISFGRAVAREFAKLLSFITFMIGYIMAAFTERKQSLHDMVVGTVVVRSR
jgi:uncharacterized RDD family membrane protein YckC